MHSDDISYFNINVSMHVYVAKEKLRSKHIDVWFGKCIAKIINTSRLQNDFIYSFYNFKIQKFCFARICKCNDS